MSILGRFFSFAISIALCIAGIGAAQAQTSSPPPLSAYGELPDVEDAAISPDGQNFALITTIGDERLILFVGPDMQLMRKMTLDDAKVRSIDWIGNDRILLVTSSTAEIWGFMNQDKMEAWTAHIVPATFDGELQTVFAGDKSLFNAVFGSFGTRRHGDQWKAYFGAWERNRRQVQGLLWSGRYLYEVDVATGKARRIANRANDDTWRDWVLSPNGAVAATIDVDRDSGSWTVSNGSAQTLAQGRDATGSAALVGLGYRGDTVIYQQRADNGIIEWYEVPLGGGDAVPFLTGTGINRLFYEEGTGRLIGHRDTAGQLHFNDPAHQAAIDKVRAAFSRSYLEIMDWSADFGKLLIRTSGNRDSGTWYIVDVATMQAAAIAFERGKIEKQHVGPISTFAYEAGDGMKLSGILTLPPGREAKDLPVVMLPHGGPHSHDVAAFNWWAQAYASRGYAVFQPNFRGSTNRDQPFMLAGYGEWGRKMQTDISDGLAALAAEGIVDPTRACIVGASYGGYAALAGVTVQNGLYRCAVAVAPVSDLHAIFEEGYEDVGRRKTDKTDLLRRFGPQSGWAAVSPRRLADRADAPILLIHGRDDTVVDYSHTTAMADKLKDSGKPYRVVELEGEDHWLSLSPTRMRMLQEAVAFVEQHNPAN